MHMNSSIMMEFDLNNPTEQKIKGMLDERDDVAIMNPLKKLTMCELMIRWS